MRPMKLLGSIAVLALLCSCFSPFSSSLEAEALSEAEKIWPSMMTECKGFYFFTRGDQMCQMKDTSFYVVDAREGSDADKMNGMEAKAQVNCGCKMYRWYSAVNGWTRWVEGSAGPGPLWIVKRNGKWVMTQMPNQRTAVECSQLPAL